MSFENLRRESIQRTQAERLLDRNLLKFEKKQIEENFKEYVNKKIKKEELTKPVEVQKERTNKDIKPHEALNKILNHLSNPMKSQKALEMIRTLFTTNFNDLETDHIFETLHRIMKNIDNYMTKEAKIAVADIFELCKKNADSILIDKDREELFKVWTLGSIVNGRLFTDDSYQLSNNVRLMRESLDFCEKLFNAEAECFPFEYELVPIQTDNNKEKQDDSITKSEINPVPEDEPKVSKASLIASKLKKKPEGAEDAKTKEAEKKEISADRPDVESIRDKLKRGMEETEKSRETDAQVKEEKSSKLDSIRNKLSKKAHESSIAKPVPMDIVEPTKRRKYEYELTEELRSLLISPKAKNFLTRKYLFNCIKDLFQKFKDHWAKSIVQNFFQDMFFRKQFFTLDQITEIERMMGDIQKGKIGETGSTFRRDFLDSKIHSTPLVSTNEVKDGRSVAFAIGGADSWASKQVGL